MVRNQWVARVGIGAVVLAIAAAGCGSSGGKTTGKHTSTGAQVAANVFNAGVDGVRNPSTVKGGTLNLGSTSDCDYWDPARTYYAFCWDLQRIFDRGLLAYDAKPGDAGLKPVPDIATTLGQASQNNTVWTYHLKQGLKFSDGTPITSADVKYAIERVFAQDVINGGPAYVVQFLQPKGPAYPGPYKDKSATGLSTIDTPDPNTIVFHLNQPFKDWDYVMTLPTSTPVEKAVDQSKSGGANYTFHVVTDGPYKIASYQPNKSISFVRNTYWDPSTDPFRKALPDAINIQLNLSPTDLDNKILDGSIDSDVSGTGVQTSTQAQIIANPNLKARSDDPITGFTRYFSIGQTVPPLNNIDCRKAVEYAIDKQSILTVAGGQYAGTIATTMSPPNLLGWQKFDLYPDNGGTGDLTQAKAELAKCGHPNGFSTHIAGNNTPRAERISAAVQQALSRVGIQTTIDSVSAATYYSTFIGSPSSVKAHDLGIMIAGWGADFPTPYGFYDQIMCGCQIKPAGNSNYGSENDPTVDHLITQATTATSLDQEGQIGVQIDKQVMADAAVIPYYYDKALVITSARTKNVFIQKALGIYDFQAFGVM